MVNILYLVEQGLLDIPVLYLSRYIIQNKGDYYRGLRSVTEQGAWEDWVAYVLQAVETRTRIEAIHDAMNEAVDAIKAHAPQMYSRELVEVIYSQPHQDRRRRAGGTRQAPNRVGVPEEA